GQRLDDRQPHFGVGIVGHGCELTERLSGLLEGEPLDGLAAHLRIAELKLLTRPPVGHRFASWRTVVRASLLSQLRAADSGSARALCHSDASRFWAPGHATVHSGRSIGRISFLLRVYCDPA